MPLQSGTRLGPYEVQAPLGKGGMGEVYRATDLRLRRDVAVKVLPTQFKPGSLSLAQFEREAHLLASLNHPNICSIYDVGVDGGTSFMVMEHLQGETLAARIERSAISANVALIYAIQIIEALAVAHNAGLVHRDIKPGNIMLTTTGVKLLDFGLAKRHMAAAASSAGPGGAETAPADATDREGIVGTLHYMAPEQLAGAFVDARSDIWAFGCVIYEMVTGRRAFNGKTLTDVITAIVTDRPPVMTTDRGVLPIALQHIVAKCLARNPAERWQTAAELARELRSLLPQQQQAGSSAAAKSDPGRGPVADSGALSSPSASSHGSKPAEAIATAEPVRTRSKAPLIAAAIVLVAIAAGAAWFFFGRGGALAPSQSVAVLTFANTGGTAGVEYLTVGLADSVAAELARRPGLRVVSTSAASRYPASDLRLAGTSLGVDRVITGRLTMRSGRVEVDTEIFDVTKGASAWSSHYSVPQNDLVPLARQLVGGVATALGVAPAGQDVQLATIPASLGSDSYRAILRGKYQLARRDEESVRRGIALLRDVAEKDASAADAFAGLADGYTMLSRPAVGGMAPNDALPMAKRAAMRALELDASRADAHVSLGTVKMAYDWDWQGAGTDLEQAVALRPDDPFARMAHAELLMNLGRSKEALAEAREATRLDPKSVEAGVALGWQLFLARQYSDAIEQLNVATKLEPKSASAHGALGAAYEKSGRPDDAARELQNAVTLSGGKTTYLAALGYAYARASRPDDARKMLDRIHATGRQSASSFDLALVAAGLDDREAVFRNLAAAVDEHAPAVAALAVDPRFDDLRADSRFADLLKRMRLP